MRYKEKTTEDIKNRDRIFVSSGINRFGERLRQAMNGMSNSEVARRCGMSETTIRKYLRGDIYPGIDSAALVAEACGVSLIWLICGLELKGDGAIDNEEAALFKDPVLDAIFKRLPETQARVLADSIIIHGVSGIIAALNGMGAIDEFMQIPVNDRERVLRLYRQIKEGDSESNQEVTPDRTKKQQRAS